VPKAHVGFAFKRRGQGFDQRRRPALDAKGLVTLAENAEGLVHLGGDEVH